VSEKERLAITAKYFMETDPNKAAEALQLSTRMYPREAAPHNLLCIYYQEVGQYEQSLEQSREAVRLAPEAMIFRANLIYGYILLDRYDEAKAAGKDALEAKLDSSQIRQGLLLLAFLTGDQASEEEQLRWFGGRPDEYQGLSVQAHQYRILGQRRKAAELLQRAAESAPRQKATEAAASLVANDPVEDALAGYCHGSQDDSLGAVQGLRYSPEVNRLLRESHRRPNALPARPEFPACAQRHGSRRGVPDTARPQRRKLGSVLSCRVRRSGPSYFHGR
jgi:tetratricopeptide (TPR) repeat protein